MFLCFIQSVKSWLPEAEAKLSSMSPIADFSRAVRIQIEEFKVGQFEILYCLA